MLIFKNTEEHEAINLINLFSFLLKLLCCKSVFIKISEEFTCCGAYTYNMGYQDWKHTVLGGSFNSVPDSCCLREATKCGANVFQVTDQRRLVEIIHTHGCITVMKARLEGHVMVIDTVTVIMITVRPTSMSTS